MDAATRPRKTVLLLVAAGAVIAASLLVPGTEDVPTGHVETSSPTVLRGLGTPVGFGQAATGGDAGPVRWVDTTEDGGPGSLRAALAGGGPAWIRFRPGTEGLLTLREPLLVPSDITIDGRGARITIDNYGFVVRDARNVIITNLIFDFEQHWDAYDGNAAITVTDGSRDVWIHHVTFQGAGPGEYHQALLFIDGASRITASWNRFVLWDRNILVGQDFENPALAADAITLHHNLFDRTHQRNPLVRFGRVHSFNNWLYHYGWPGTGVGMVVDAGAQLVSEADIFEDAYGRYAIKSGDWDSPARPGSIWRFGSALIGVRPDLVDQGGPDVVFDPLDEYHYRADPADDDLRAALRDRTGWQSFSAGDLDDGAAP